MSLTFDIARVVLELTSPFRISGQEDTGSPWDATFVVDPNGVPAIPGASMAGVLRHAFALAHGEEDPDTGPLTTRLFGYQRKDDGRASRLSVSWGHALGADGVPASMTPRAPSAENRTDAVLELLRTGVLRDHVALSHRGVAGEHTKYDELLVPCGARFLFELRLDRAEEDAASLTELLTLLAGPWTRLGGSTRRGMGAFRLCSVQKRSFDLRRKDDRSALARLPGDLSMPIPAGVLSEASVPGPTVSAGWVTATLDLVPEDYWLFGGGHPHRPEHQSQKEKVQRRGNDDPKAKTELFQWESAINRVPVTERRIRWLDGRGTVTSADTPEHLAPASSVKGAIRHRAEFHCRRLAGAGVSVGVQPWEAAPNLLKEQVETLAATPSEPISALFGFIKTRSREGADEESLGNAGRVFFEDAWLDEPTYGRLDHVSLDRFTHGPMDGMLFSEAPLYKGRMVRMHLAVQTEPGLPAEAIRAFAAALDDLCQGRLALGAHSARGLGYFQGLLTWSDRGQWIRGEAP